MNPKKLNVKKIAKAIEADAGMPLDGLRDSLSEMKAHLTGKPTMKCPVCGAAELTHDTRDLPYTYKGETTVIAAVTGEFCSTCGESILDPLESSRVMSEMSDFSKSTLAGTIILYKIK